MGSDDCVTRERYVALQAWLCGQMSPRAPHAADLFAQDRECLYDAFLSVLVGTGLGFVAFDDDRTHHGLYAFDFFVGDIKVPPREKGVDVRRAPGMAGESATDAAGRAMCHALVDTWLGDVGRHIPFVASVIASVATLELVADVSIDECVFECELPPEYAADTAPMPWESGGLPVGSVDPSLLVPGPTIRVEACPPSWAAPLESVGFSAALGKSVEMGLRVCTAQVSDGGVSALLRSPHARPEMLGWAADAVARALSACGHVGRTAHPRLAGRRIGILRRSHGAHARINVPRPRRL